VELLSDLKTLYHLAAKPVRGADHATRLESFYAGQATGYDRFRRRLLQGRRALWEAIPVPPGGTWLDLGGGTGENVEYLGDRLRELNKLYVVDLCPSLLAIARQRVDCHGWHNVELAQADVTGFQPAERAVDIVTFSYSLTMIPNWFAAVHQAHRLLRPGGLIGVVDFYVSRKFPAPELRRHGWWTRTFWPAWFARDNVFLSADHLPFLQTHFQPVALHEGRARLPYVPLLRVPYYTFLGRRADGPSESKDAPGHL
jgi:S-adenosylmethionine-diacylgycerolhomoserine-N-methlytransferase